MKSLLPPNHTALEKNIASAGEDAFDIASIKVIKNIDEVPMQFLSFLAYQKSVDYWDESWQDALKRQVIKDAKEQHKIKGTAAAIKQALEPFGYEVKLIEWFNQSPIGTPGTFALELDLIGRELNAEVFYEVNRLIYESKAASRHISNLQITSNPIMPNVIVFAAQHAVTFESRPLL